MEQHTNYQKKCSSEILHMVIISDKNRSKKKKKDDELVKQK